MINGVNLLSNTITFWLLLNSTSFVGLLTIYSPYSMILSIVHAINISSEKVSSFRKFCRSQFANFIVLLFSKSVRASSTPFLYERYPRSCLKILTGDPLEISSSPATDTLHSFSHLFNHSFGRDNAKEWDKLIVPVSLTIVKWLESSQNHWNFRWRFTLVRASEDLHLSS